MTIESRAKIKINSSGANNGMFGRHHSEETKQKMRELATGINSHSFGKHRSIETRLKMSKANIGRVVTAETRKKIGESRLGEKNWNYGKSMSAESKLKLSLSLTGKKHTPEQNLAQSKRTIGTVTSQVTKEKLRTIMTGRVLTKEWKDKISKAHTGKKNPLASGPLAGNWKGGITPENQKIRQSLEYKLWRKSVFERDNFICQKTEQWGGKLHAHHINNFADKKDVRLAIDNGVTLSKESHELFHHIYGKKNNTREQLIEFLNN